MGRAYQRLPGGVLAAAVLLVTLGSADLEAQPPEGEPRFSFSDSVAVRWVLIPVIVRSERGLVGDLEVVDFELRIDGLPVAIETFENRVDAPASVVFLQDLSGSMANQEKLERSRRALDLLLELTRWGDEFALVTFAGSEVTLQQPFTPDRELLQHTAKVWRGEGTTGLYDAVTWLPEFTLEARRTRRAAVVLTDGVDNASVLEPAVAQEQLVKTELPVYVFDLSGFGLVPNPQKAQNFSDPGIPLQQLAAGTGGGYYRPQSETEMVLACHEVAAELRRQYLLGFAADGSRPAARHQVEVRLAHGLKHRVRYRPGFFGPPPMGFP